jgi:hypothetical protein
MKTFVAVCGAVVLSAALVNAQAKPAGEGNNAENNNGASASTVTFTGCLNPGSNADSYYLTNAKQKGVKNADKSLKIVAAPKVKLEPFVTGEVEVTGTVDPADAAAASSEGSSKTRTLTVTKVKLRHQYCG